VDAGIRHIYHNGCDGATVQSVDVDTRVQAPSCAALPAPTMTAPERRARGCKQEIRKNRRDVRFRRRVRWSLGYPEADT